MPHSTSVRNQFPGHAEIGPYRLIGSLGRGGMAEVFMAEHRHLAQVRAVKVVLPHVAPNSELIARLLTEARATARLRHPAIVQVFDCDTLAQGGAFIAMEYLKGEPVSRWLARASGLGSEPRLAAAIVGVVADGLAYAHGEGVVHRDVKPENLFLVPEARDRHRFSVRILDFGLAKLLGEESLITTRDGSAIGTPLYMAPEQWRGGGCADVRADIYSLGCVLFELLVGRPPFVHADGWEVMQAHFTETPAPVATLVPAIPRALDQLVTDMLAKSPCDRPQSMAAVLARLVAFLGCAPAQFGALLLAPPHAPVASGTGCASSAGEVTLLGPPPAEPRAIAAAESPEIPVAAATPVAARAAGFGPRRLGTMRALGSAAIIAGALAATTAAVAFILQDGEDGSVAGTPRRVNSVAAAPPRQHETVARPVKTAAPATPAAPAVQPEPPAPAAVRSRARPAKPAPVPTARKDARLAGTAVIEDKTNRSTSVYQPVSD